MTKKHLGELRHSCAWVRVLEPVLWQSDELDPYALPNVIWRGSDELVEAVRNELIIMNVSRADHHATRAVHALPTRQRRLSRRLPPEIWSWICNFVGDWEVAQALRVHTQLPWPLAWAHHRPDSKALLDPVLKALEWAVLTGTINDVVWLLETGPAPKELTPLAVKIIIKFGLTDLLSYLDQSHNELLVNTFGHMRLPDKASTIFGNVKILEWWRRSPSILTRRHGPEAYNHEPLDGASRAGFVHVLEWWGRSGLPLRYSEAALEQVSARGHLEVLEWWRQASLGNDDHTRHNPPFAGQSHHTDTHKAIHSPVKLKVGKAICFAAQNGQADAIRWWDRSGIPYAHQNAVTRLASANGHVNVLKVWKELKGEKMIYDNLILVGATHNGHWRVLQWWKDSGFVVEYRPSDIEEALEDSLGSPGEQEVRTWWAQNGSMLGIGTSEWMQTKVL